jgi:hypothetical protein
VNLEKQENIRRMHVIMGKQACKKAKKKGVDLWLVLGGACVNRWVLRRLANIALTNLIFLICTEPPADFPTGDYCLLSGRFLMYDISKLGISNRDRDQLYKFMLDCLPRNGVSTERMGGSNGTAERVDAKAFKELLLYSGSTPRDSQGAVWALKDTELHVYYVTPYERYRVVHFCYAMPVMAGQFRLTRTKLRKAPKKFAVLAEVCVTSKLTMAEALDVLNRRIKKSENGWWSFSPSSKTKILPTFKHTLIATEAVTVQQATNEHIRGLHPDGNLTDIVMHHAMTTSMTVVSTALGMHVDHTRKHPLGSGWRSFIEPKLLLTVPGRSYNSKRHDGQEIPPLGRGGAGEGIFTYAFLDHSFWDIVGQNWGAFRDHFNLRGQLTLTQFYGARAGGNIPVDNQDNLNRAVARYNLRNTQYRANIDRNRRARARNRN